MLQNWWFLFARAKTVKCQKSQWCMWHVLLSVDQVHLSLLAGWHTLTHIYIYIYHLENRWRNSHVLVYHGPLVRHLLGAAPSTFTLCTYTTSQIWPSWRASATCRPHEPSFGLTMLSMEIVAPLNTVRINTMSAAVRAKPRAALSICEQRTTSHANLRGLINQSFHSGVLVEGPPIRFYRMFWRRPPVSSWCHKLTRLHSKWF